MDLNGNLCRAAPLGVSYGDKKSRGRRWRRRLRGQQGLQLDDEGDWSGGTGLGEKVVPRLRESCRQSQVEVVTATAATKFTKPGIHL